MTKHNKPIGTGRIGGYFEIPPFTYKLLYSQRILVEIELFKLFPNGKYVYEKTKEILNHDLFNTSIMKTITLAELHYMIMNNFYQELFYNTNMHNIVIDDNVYRKGFFDYFGKKFEADSIEKYNEILTKFYKLQTKKFYQYNPHLKGDDFLGNYYFNHLEKLLNILTSNNEKDVKNRLRKERKYLPRQEYTIEMLAYYNEQRKKGMKRIPAAEETFKNFYSEDHIKNFIDFENKIDSFIRSASKIKL